MTSQLERLQAKLKFHQERAARIQARIDRLTKPQYMEMGQDEEPVI